VVLSGVIANPLALLDKLDELGVRIANDDLINAGRRLRFIRLMSTLVNVNDTI
jgi:hypothetical protein